MKSFGLSIALGASLASAQVFTCNGYQRPNWDDCKSPELLEEFGLNKSN